MCDIADDMDGDTMTGDDPSDDPEGVVRVGWVLWSYGEENIECVEWVMNNSRYHAFSVGSCGLGVRLCLSGGLTACLMLLVCGVGENVWKEGDEW